MVHLEQIEDYWCLLIHPMSNRRGMDSKSLSPWLLLPIQLKRMLHQLQEV